MLKRFLFRSLLVVLFVGTNFSQEKTLYERLGGVKPISLVVNDFIDRLVANDVLNANPMIKAGRNHSPDAYLKFQVTNLVCQVTGGPCVYTGLGMKESHQHLNITENEWQVMRDEFKKSLDKFGVPDKEQKELFDIVESTKKDIVEMK
ncbi:MAG: globin [Ignavibacteria bacterium GWA2_35_9]|nr:MAG: globin [Ignavibacteria bacterium GWA2_35_9]OGU44916.1 MAG: globin [Ignavibacteria bacterium GWB2_36_8]OGU51015.1 MAG: globin [Ignavibacteria bacterium GWC2_36_12]